MDDNCRHQEEQKGNNNDSKKYKINENIKFSSSSSFDSSGQTNIKQHRFNLKSTIGGESFPPSNAFTPKILYNSSNTDRQTRENHPSNIVKLQKIQHFPEQDSAWQHEPVPFQQPRPQASVPSADVTRCGGTRGGRGPYPWQRIVHNDNSQSQNYVNVLNQSPQVVKSGFKTASHQLVNSANYRNQKQQYFFFHFKS